MKRANSRSHWVDLSVLAFLGALALPLACGGTIEDAPPASAGSPHSDGRLTAHDDGGPRPVYDGSGRTNVGGGGGDAVYVDGGAQHRDGAQWADDGGEYYDDGAGPENSDGGPYGDGSGWHDGSYHG